MLKSLIPLIVVLGLTVGSGETLAISSFSRTAIDQAEREEVERSAIRLEELRRFIASLSDGQRQSWKLLYEHERVWHIAEREQQRKIDAQSAVALFGIFGLLIGIAVFVGFLRIVTPRHQTP